MELKYGIEELWLNPSNLLMISQNIKNGLQEYIDSSYLNKEIDVNYNELKLKLSELDAEIKVTAQNSSIKTLIVSNDVFRFLEKYGFEVISIDPDTATEKDMNTAQERISNGTSKYIFTLENEGENANVTTLQQSTSTGTITLRNLSNITDDERNNSSDYIKLMNENLELIKRETYR
jgi:zinc transport system substrate-binding protein